MLVGHNIGAFDLAVILARMQHHKVRAGGGGRSYNWTLLCQDLSYRDIMRIGHRLWATLCMGPEKGKVPGGLSHEPYPSTPWSPHSPPLGRQVPLWSRIGRLKRSSYPNLSGGGHSFGGGASPGARAFGRVWAAWRGGCEGWKT